MSTGLDFGKIPAATSKGYLKPGVYDLKVIAAKYEKPENGKSSYVKTTFTDSAGASMNVNFYVTEGAAGRLAYVHEAMFGKPLSKSFDSLDAAGAYFEGVLNKYQPTKRILVGGREGNDGKIYADLPYTGFVMDENTPVGPFEEGSTQYNNNIQKNKQASALSSGNAIISGSDDGSDDMPF